MASDGSKFIIDKEELKPGLIRLNKLYIELLKDNPEWGTAERRPDMNHFMARLIFCFFAEDTDIFHRSFGFTDTIEKMSERDSSNTHEVIGELFRAMNTRKSRHPARVFPCAPFRCGRGGGTDQGRHDHQLCL